MIVIPADVSCKLGLAAVGGAACAVGHLDPEAAPRALFQLRERAQGQREYEDLVSHRFSTVRIANLIFVLDGARVAEVGTH